MSLDRKRLSDRQLRALLKGLREDVAAPADFRQGVMKRLQAEGLVAAGHAPAPLSWRERLWAWPVPARVGLALGGALALAVVLFPTAPKSPSVTASAPAADVDAEPVVAAAPQPAQAPQRAQSRPQQPQRQAPAPIELSGAEHSLEAPALGSQDAAPASESLQLTSANVVAKPTVIVVEPTPTPLVQALPSDSQVRNNVVRAARGEAALILFTVRQAGRVRIEIHDRLGRLVAVLRDNELSAGEHSVRWSGAADEGFMAASGVYQVRIQAPGYEARHKVVLVK